MNKIEALFRRKPKDITAVYFTAGYPNPDDTVAVLQSLENAGADLIEIGMPFSDPLADGPVIQESSKKALENGMSISTLFSQLEGFPPSEIPRVLMGYLNPVLQFGFEKFLKRCRTTGIDGVILPDLPVEVFEK